MAADKTDSKKKEEDDQRTINVHTDTFDELLKIKDAKAKGLGIQLSWNSYFLLIMKEKALK